MRGKRRIYAHLKDGIKQIQSNSVSGYIKRPNFNLSGNREMFVEGHISVEKYDDNEIALSVDEMTVFVNGRELNMCFYNRHTVKLTGFITDIRFEHTCSGGNNETDH